MLAHGDVNAAIQEYDRLAALGSGRARCITAYAYLMGSFLTPRDQAAAKRIALSATSSEPGYSNYILGFVALAEGDHASRFTHFITSRKAGFLPAFSASAQLFTNLYHSAERDLKLAENLFLRAIRVGHIPAYMLLAVFYLRGKRGLLKRFVGLVLYPISLIAFYFAWKFSIFSMATFMYHPTYRDLLRHSR
jgi:TPR repeat protein